MNQRTKYLGQGSFGSKFSGHRQPHRHTRPTALSEPPKWSVIVIRVEIRNDITQELLYILWCFLVIYWRHHRNKWRHKARVAAV